MKNNNELKPLFRNIDVKPSPMMVQGNSVSTIEFNSLYNDINEVIVPNMINQRPFNNMDVELIRQNLCNMFKYRVENVLKNTISILVTRLNGLENKVYEFIRTQTDDMYMHINIRLSHSVDNIVKDIINDFPYIVELPLYFDINHDFQFIKILALSITTKIYNELKFSVHSDDEILKDEEIQVINEIINQEFKKFTNSIIDDINILLLEAKTVYFTSGDFVPFEDGRPIHYSKVENYLDENEQVEIINQDSKCESIKEEKIKKLLDTLNNVF